jgi:hypothetical protein
VRGDEEVHAGAPGVDEAGVQFDEFTDADGPVEMGVADVGGDAAAVTPLCGNGVGGLVDPSEQRAAVDGAAVAGVSGVTRKRRIVLWPWVFGGTVGSVCRAGLCPLRATDRCREPSRVTCCVVCILIGLPAVSAALMM